MKYTILERKDPSAGMPGVKLENGLRFVVHDIAFNEDDSSEATLSFNYDLLCKPTFPKEEYEQMIGDWLRYVIECAIEDKTLDKML